MSQYYGSIQGQAVTEATRRGSKSGGLTAHIRGWDCGVKVLCSWDDEAQEDVIEVYRTGGSKQPAISEHLVTIRT